MPSPEEPDKSDDSVPDPELSPTTNPILAQNLGLWAQVYYTTPPEQRDQAVQKLLAELKGDAASEGTTRTVAQATAVEEVVAPPASERPAERASKENDSPEPAKAATAQPDLNKPVTTASAPASLEPAPPAVDDALVCPACLHKNRPQQHFCGLCGFPLKSSRREPSDRVATINKPAPVPLAPPAQPAPAPRQIERSEESWDWLREKNATGFDTSSEHSGTWKYIALVAGVLVVLLLASVWWAGSGGSRSSVPTREPQQVSPAPAPEPPQRKPATSSGPATSANPTTSPVEPPSAEKSNPPSAKEASSAPVSPVAPESADDDGSAELTQARRYLSGKEVPRDSMAASFWLWKSVAKKNTQAVLLLSDLYARGDGVSKSCDQARVLLQAAAERGSTEASAKLVNLHQTICP